MAIPNPWHALPKTPPYVLAGDAAPIQKANLIAHDRLQIHLDLLPEPYIGAVTTAPVVLLSLNPSFSEHDYPYYARPEAYAASRANLLHAPSDYPFIFLDPRLLNAAHPAGPEWWSGKLRALIKACSVEKVARGLACIELFPYHSRNYRPLGVTLSSQAYTFQLVRQAMQRSALLVMMRAKRFWLAAVPELATYPYVQLKNVQNVSVSPNNLPAGVFERIVDRLR